MRVLGVAAVAAAVCAVAAPAASADVFCVHKTPCPPGGISHFDSGDRGQDLQDALDEAANTDGPNTVEVGPGEFALTGGFDFGHIALSQETDIVGSGSSFIGG